MASRLAVYCGSNSGVDERFAADARALGTAMVERGIGLVYGGGRVGLMGVIADAVLAAGGDVTGVITSHLVGAEIAHTGVGELHVVETMHERKALMTDLADGLVALPGGFGTLDEVLEMLTWNQLGLVAKPVVFLDTGGFYGELFAFFDHAVAAGFVRDIHRDLARQALTPAEAIDLATAPPPPTAHKWIDRDTLTERG
ncbi:MAG: TIGR00730 family Rossman fold protein [Actinomycetota bacterium]|nr:TIGR00730 family Rossman fold protein [Actinomycetota bacterium]